MWELTAQFQFVESHNAFESVRTLMIYGGIIL
jgi:hypothetical protein